MSTESRKGIELKIASLVQALSKPSASALARYERNAAGSKAPSAKVCGMATARRMSELITTSCTLTTVHRGPQHQSMVIASQLFREIMSSFPSGVAIVTAHESGA